MNALTEKRYLTLPEPSAGDTLAARERLLAALPEGCRLTLGCMQQLYPVLHEAGYRVTVTLCPGAGGTDVVRVEPGDTTDRNYGLCLDIGSTTMQMELVDLLSGKTLAEAACTNSQTQFGANILDRILAVKENPDNLHTLQALTLDDVRQMIERCCAQAGVPPEAVSAMTVGGNTTMLHFFLGCDPWQVFQSPYTPVFFDPGVLRASELGLPIAGNIFCMPAIANYLGGDITSGLLMTDLDTREDLALFLDIGTNGELKNISFGLYAAEEIVSASGTSIPANGLVEIISLNEDGTAKVKTDLPLGSYYVKELATDSHYLLSDTKYPVTFEYAGQDIAVVKISANDGKAIENDLIYGSVSGKKVDENGDSLGGALIGLFRTDDGEFTKENALLTATSAEDGSFSFENIPYGTWYVREIEQPAGFVLDDTIYPVTIGADGQVVEIKIVNTYVRGNIHLTKVDSEYPDNKLTGATFEVYKDSNANGKLDDGDELLGTLTEKEKGEYSMNDLFYGRYFVKETKAPEGFVLDTGVYEVMIDTNGKTYEVENKAGVGFINEAMRGNLKIVKTSSDGKVKGFAFRITGANGYDIILETNDKGEIFLDGLRIGDYTISEVSNSTSSMYVLPADKKATVKIGSTTIVEMHNLLRDTPKTGDTTNLPLLYALAGLSAVGIAVCGVIGFKKKKKEDRN